MGLHSPCSDRALIQGFIGSRQYSQYFFPQKIQNQIIRDFLIAHNFRFALSATEYVMPGSDMMLMGLLGGLDNIDGIAFFQLGMLPRQASVRRSLYSRLLAEHKLLCFALEGVIARTQTDFSELECLIQGIRLLPRCLQKEELKSWRKSQGGQWPDFAGGGMVKLSLLGNGISLVSSSRLVSSTSRAESMNRKK